MFELSSYIYLPGAPADWTTPRSCVWRGPKSLKAKSVLESVYGESAEAEALLVGVVGIRNASYHDVLEDLLALRNTSEPRLGPSAQTLTELYTTLNEMVQSDEDCADLR